MKSELIPIFASSEFEACEKIYEHIENAKIAGWVPSKNYALVDGWKNQYEFVRNQEKYTLEFDMRPSLHMFSSELIFIMHSLMLTQPDALHKMRCLRDGKPIDQQNYFWGYVFWAIVAAIIIYIVNQ